MPKDRLSDLKIVRQNRGRGRSEEDDDECKNEKDKLLSKEHWDTIDQYLERVSCLRTDITNLEEDLKTIKQSHSTLLTQPSRPELTKELTQITERFTVKLKVLQQAIKEMNEEVEKNEQKGNAVTEVNNRIKRDQVNALIRSFSHLMEKFNTEQLDYKERSRKKYTEYLKVFNTSIPDDVLEEAIEQGTVSEKLKGVVLAHAEKAALFEDVKARNDDLLKLERSIRELSEMFMDMHLLVAQQGEILNNIAINVERSVDYAVKAREDITSAKKQAQKARWMKIGLIIGSILLILILFGLLKLFICFYAPFLCS